MDDAPSRGARDGSGGGGTRSGGSGAGGPGRALKRLGAGAAAVLALGVAAAACQSGTLPDGEVRFEDVSLPTPLPVEPEPVVDRPTPGLSPRMVATGFMRAMSTLDPGVVGPWLTAAGRERVQTWSTASEVDVYNGFNFAAWTEGSGRAEAVVRVERRGALADDGEWLPGAGERELVLRMAREAGEWRVAEPPAVPLVADADFRRLFARATVYFVTAGGDYLSPQPILLRARPPGGAGSPDGTGAGAAASVAAVVERLLAGPRDEGAEALRTAIPGGTELRGVEVVDGVAKVNLSAPFASEDGPAGRLRVGQLVWTVSQLFGVPEVELAVEGQPLARVGPDGFDATGTWHFSRPPLDGLRPSRGGSDDVVLFTRDGQLNRIGVDVTDGEPAVVPFAPVGVVRAPTWSPDGSRIAFLVHTAVGDTLWIGSADGGEAVRVGLSGRLSEPSWSPDGSRVLLLRAESPPEAAGTATALWSYRVGQGTQAERLTLSPLPGGLQPTVLRVSPDGAAVLAVGARGGRGFRFGGGGQLYRGWLTASGVTGWSTAPLAPGFGTVYSPVWAGNDQVAFIAKHHGHGDLGAIWSMAADGWRPERVEFSPDQVVIIGDRLTTDARGDRFVFTVHTTEGATEIFSIQRQNTASLRRLARADQVTVDSDPSLASR